MPELPEVETVRTGLDTALKNAVIQQVTLRRKDLRTPFPKELEKALEGRRILDVSRRAKYLIFTLDSDDAVIAHLGMSGRFSVEPKCPQFTPHDHVAMELKDGRWLVYNDARRFGVITLAKKTAINKHPLLAHLGLEPLDKDFTASYLKAALLKRSGPIKSVLMDQELVVGIGNIYASEALFLAGIDPRKPAKSVADKAPLLIKSIRKVLKDAIESGGSSLRDFLHVSGESGYFQHHFNVYDRAGEPCLSCKTLIGSLRQAGRSTFFCGFCQK